MDIDFNSIGSAIEEPSNSNFLSTSVPQNNNNNIIFQQYGNQQQHNIGNYVLGKTLGIGRFGCVKQATDSRNGKQVAIKFVDKVATNGKESSHQSNNVPLKREAEMLKFLKHKNIVKLHEVLETPTQVLLVMEYIHNGKDLFTLISRRGKLTESQAKVIFHQIVDAVKYCHARYIVHRDIKCENIMVCELPNQLSCNNNETNINSQQDSLPFSMDLEDTNNSQTQQQSNLIVKLIDFGLSTSFQFPTRNDNTMWGGSIEYASPEVIFRRPFLGPEVDIWSCGVVLFVMTCGYLPFQGHNDHEIANKIKLGQFKLPINLSPECKDLIASMLQVDPSQRAKIPDVQKHPWFRDMPVHVSLEGTSSLPMDTPSLNRSSFSQDPQASGFGLSSFKRSISDSEVYHKVMFPLTTANNDNNNATKKTNNDNNNSKDQQTFQVPRKTKPKLKRQTVSSPPSLLSKRTSPQDEEELTDQSSAPMDQDEEFSKRSRFDF